MPEKQYTDNWFRLWRESEGFTLEDLASEVGVSKVYLANIERGRKKPALATAERIADALDVEVIDVFPPDGYPTPREVAIDYWEDNPPRRNSRRSKR